MGAVAAIIASIWLVLVGAALGGRRVGLSRRARGLFVTLIYAALAVTCVFVLGPSWNAVLGTAGMLFPYAAAMACVFIL